ncbi:MAG: hypothetical protein H8E78_05935 [Proteobacteria bacterium]|nr:hypothetical protein [Pseudomonadota bacterium]
MTVAFGAAELAECEAFEDGDPHQRTELAGPERGNENGDGDEGARHPENAAMATEKAHGFVVTKVRGDQVGRETGDEQGRDPGPSGKLCTTA